jgi:alpha-methylacyl-CoA racemase
VGPLCGLKVVEFVGIGPGPFAAMLLADMGASVIRIDRTDAGGRLAAATPAFDLLARGRPSISVNLKHQEGVACALRLIERADALVEGFRPGVMERLGLGPQECLARHPRLVYGRMTGWGQTGPLADRAGHDIDYIAVAGALHGIGRAGDNPVPPLNLVGDFGGGGMLLAFGILCATYESQRSGRGQIVDAAMVDGAALLLTMFYGMRGEGQYLDQRGVNMLDTGAPFYETYETSDGKHMAVGAIEPQFYAELLQRLQLDPATLPDQMDRSSWPAMKRRFADLFKTRSADQWCTAFEGSDACVAPVLGLRESAAHPHMRSRQSVVNIDGVLQPAPAPRFSRTSPDLPVSPSPPGRETDSALQAWGFSLAEIERLRAAQAIG